MQRGRYLILPLTVFGICFLVFPMLDAMSTTLPLRFGEAGWRFGAEGLVITSILFPLLGMLMLMGAASLKDSTGPARLMTVVSGILCLGLVVLLLGFVLDAVQVRGKVPAQALNAFDRATILAVIRNGGALAVAICYFVSARRMARDSSRGQARPNKSIIGVSGKPRSEASASSTTA